MQSKLLNRDNPRIFAVVFDAGDEVTTGLVEFARQQTIAGASFTAMDEATGLPLIDLNA